MSHTLTSYLGSRDFNATSLADDPPVFHPFIFAAETFIIIDRPEDLGTKEAIFFRLERSVIDGFRLYDLAPRPALDLLG